MKFLGYCLAGIFALVAVIVSLPLIITIQGLSFIAQVAAATEVAANWLNKKPRRLGFLLYKHIVVTSLSAIERHFLSK